MKTFQQVLKEYDEEELTQTYFSQHSERINVLEDINDIDEKITIADLKRDARKSFHNYLERLKNLEIEPFDDGEEMIAFAFRSSYKIDNGIRVDIVNKNELLEKKEKAQSYGLEYTRQEKILGILIADNHVTKKNLDDVLVELLWIANFFGLEQEDLEKAQKELEEAAQELDEDSKSFSSVEEMYEEFGWDLDELDSESTDEEELHDKIREAQEAYFNHSRAKEVAQIIEEMEK